MRKRRRRTSITTPRGNLWAVPPAHPIRVFDLAADPSAFKRHWDYLTALAQDKPASARAILQRTQRLAERYTKRFRKTQAKAVLVLLTGSFL